MNNKAQAQIAIMKQNHQAELRQLHDEHLSTVVNFQNEMTSQQIFSQRLQTEFQDSLRFQKQLMEEMKEMKSHHSNAPEPCGPERRAVNRDDELILLSRQVSTHQV